MKTLLPSNTPVRLVCTACTIGYKLLRQFGPTLFSWSPLPGKATGLILAVLLLLGSLGGHAQPKPGKLVNIMPPNVASFEKYGNIPLNYSTGQITYSVPLFTLPVDDNLSIPIALNYSNAGLKPDEVPSWVGHGWDLMVGGYITQSVQGIDDFSDRGLQQGWIRGLKNDYLRGLLSSGQASDWAKGVSEMTRDAQYDIFSLNILGKSTKFFLNGTTPVFLEYSPYKITFSPQGSTLVQNFTVTDENGYNYFFAASVDNSGSYTDNPQLDAGPYLLGARTWYLTKIVTPGQEEVTFTYISDATYNVYTSWQVKEFGGTYVSGIGCGILAGVPHQESSNVTVGQLLLQQISFKGRHVSFTTIARNDLLNARALAAIRATNEFGKTVSEINFSFTNGPRLMLDQVAVANPQTGAPVKNYRFDYLGKATCAATPLVTDPNRVFGVDHWGFANGSDCGAANGIPRLDYTGMLPTDVAPLDRPNVHGDCSRRARSRYSQAGMLGRVTYPTGGYSEFTYKANELRYARPEDIPFFLRTDTITFGCLALASDGVRCPDRFNPGSTSGAFTVSPSHRTVLVKADLVSSNDSEFSSLRITGPNNNQVFYRWSYNESSTTRLTLPAGRYGYNLSAGCITPLPDIENNSGSYAGVELYGCTDSLRVEIGGNRVVRIEDVDPTRANVNVRQFEYYRPNLLHEPDYVSALIEVTGAINPCGGKVVLSGNSKSKTGWDGYHISYDRVAEVVGSQGEGGKSIYYYASGQAITSYQSDPFPAAQNLSWRNSALTGHQIFRREGTGYVLQKETLYDHTPLLSNRFTLENVGVVFRRKAIFMGGMQPAYPPIWSTYAEGRNTLGTDYFDKAKVTETEYHNGSTLRKETTYAYTDDYFRLRRTNTTNSGGIEISQFNWYPSDYSATADASIPALTTNHMVGLPLKTVKAVQGNIVAGEVYRRDARGNVVAQASYKVGAPAPLPTHDPAVYTPAGFRPEQRIAYTPNNKVREQARVNEAPTTYLWGYNSTHPVAVIKNASYADVVAVLGQSVVDDLAGPAPGSDEQVRAKLAPLRTSPALKRAQITTYTHDLLVGMTSQTDPAGHTTTYEYDALGRLVRARDERGRILSQQRYNYAGQ